MKRPWPAFLAFLALSLPLHAQLKPMAVRSSAETNNLASMLSPSTPSPTVSLTALESAHSSVVANALQSMVANASQPAPLLIVLTPQKRPVEVHLQPVAPVAPSAPPTLQALAPARSQTTSQIVVLAPQPRAVSVNIRALAPQRTVNAASPHAMQRQQLAENRALTRASKPVSASALNLRALAQKTVAAPKPLIAFAPHPIPAPVTLVAMQPRPPRVMPQLIALAPSPQRGVRALRAMHMPAPTMLAQFKAMWNHPQLAEAALRRMQLENFAPPARIYAMVLPGPLGVPQLVLLAHMPSRARLVQQVVAQTSSPQMSSAEALRNLVNIAAAQQTLAVPLPQVTSEQLVREQEERTAPQPSGPEQLAAVETPQTQADEDLLLQFRLDGIPSEDLLTARRTANGTLYLPLADIIRRLGFPIEIAGNMGSAHGWFMEEGRTFVLNQLDGYVEISGKRAPLKHGSVMREGDELYVSAAQLQEWFPVTFDIAYDKLVLNTKTNEMLPQAARIARQRIWDRYRMSSIEKLDGPTSMLERPYADWPGIKITEGTSFNHQADGNHNSFSNNLGIEAQGTLLAMDSYLSLAFTQGREGEQGLSNANFRLSKDSIASTTMLGPLAATHVEVGDISLPRLSLLSNQTTGRGFSFNNQPEGFAGSLNQFELKGEGPLGWDVEVYQDDALVTFSTIQADGRYHFDQLNLHPGNNDFRVVLYGPNGEKRERRESFYLGEGMVKPGQWVYQAGATQSSQPVIAANVAPQKGGGTLVFNSFYGINRNLSLNLGALDGPVGSSHATAQGATAGLRGSYGRTFSQFNIAGFADGSTAYTARQSTRLGKSTDITTYYTRNASTTIDPLAATSIAGVKLNDTFNIGIPLRYGLEVSRENFRTKQPEELLTATQAWRLGKTSFNNILGRRFAASGDRWQNGQLSFSRSVMGLPWHGQLSYLPDADDPITSASLSTQMRLDEGATLALLGQYQPSENRTSMQAKLQREIGDLTLGLSSGWQSDNSFQLGVNLGTQFLPEPGGGPSSYKMVAARGEGFGYGSADIFVFTDDNMNGIYEEGEAKLANVEIRNNRTGQSFFTNADGVARVTDLLPDQKTTVELVENSLPDLYLKPAARIHNLLAPRGYGGKIGFPVLPYGEIAGTAIAAAGVDVRQATLWLTNVKGETLETLHPESDGGFYFQSIPLGTYYVNARLAGIPNMQQEVRLTKASPMASSLQLSLAPANVRPQ